MKFFRQSPRLLCAALLLASASSAGAQSPASYPSKPVRIILPYAPGGATGAVSAIFADKLGKNLGQAFLVDNRAGGDTIVGTATAAKAAPDGYTLLANTSTLLVNYGLQPDLPYDTLKDLAPISGLSRSESVLTIHPSAPIKDLKEFVEYSKANPDKLNAASSSTVVVLHYQRLMNATGAKMSIVPYKGGGPIMTDLLAGTVNVFISNVLNVQTLIKAGKLRGLAISGSQRSSLLPEVPTFAEVGLKDYDPNNWLALFAPAKTPKAIIEKLNAEVRKVQESPEVVGALAGQGITPYPLTVAQAETFIRMEADRFIRLVKESGLKPGDY